MSSAELVAADGAAPAEASPDRRGKPFAELGLLLVVFLLVQLLPTDTWRGGGLLVVLVAGLAWLNARRFPGGAFCWPTIFLFILALFHLGYYVAVVANAAPTISSMPDVIFTTGIDRALFLFAEACVCFELGAFAFLALSSRKPTKAPRIEIRDYRRAFFNLGLAVTAMSLVLYVIYLDQIGGIGGLRSLDYTTYVSFLQSSDPRFAALSATYLPAGLLLLYTFIDRSDPGSRMRVRIVLTAFFVFALWLLWVGNRGAALLDCTALAYIHHTQIRPLPLRRLLVAAVAMALVISPVRQLRTVSPIARGQAVSHLNYSPVQAVTEMGLTFRPYLAFVQQRDSGKSLGAKPYTSALSHVAPRVGLGRASNSQPVFRTTQWITDLVDPTYASEGFGLGGSAIGESYITFGEPGVICAFLLLGWGIAWLEWGAAVRRSMAAIALIPLVFYGVTWYVRDDAYGLLRPVIWGLAAVALTGFLARVFARRRVASALRLRPSSVAR